MKLDKKLWDYLWEEWIKPILIAAVLALFIRTFFIQPFKIPSSSMYPTLQPGDRIFVNKLLYGPKIPFTKYRLPGLRQPKLGDIVVFISPIESNKYLVKRFIAGENEAIHIESGNILLDGEKIKKQPFGNFFYYNRGEYGADDKTVNVPEGYFFVLGDNSANSMDSRYWGFVPEENLIGRAFIIHWPIKRIRLIREGY